MIEIVDLVKRYGNGENAVTALDGVSLTLPDTGLVFILGKSGSGKSTLLNMLGGLDDITSGDIIYNGKSFAHMTEGDMDVYRANYLGMIFQSFNLFPMETVHDNIYVAAKADKRDTAEEDIDRLLSEVDLANKKNVLVKNLSGGQKQRVVIARALIKESQVILADEPTGNLDSKNTKAVFDLLKKISEKCLLIVVSHDKKSAYAYADRIITLSDGAVLSDETRSKRDAAHGKFVLELPDNCPKTPEEIEKINKKLADDKVFLYKGTPSFSPTKKIKATAAEERKFGKYRKNVTGAFHVSLRFLKSSLSSTVVTVILLSVLLSLLSFSQNFINFDDSAAIQSINDSYESKTYVLQKAYSEYDTPYKINKDYLIATAEEDKQTLFDAGYTGNIYDIYNMSVCNDKIATYHSVGDATYAKFYSKGALGVAVVDRAFLENVFDGANLVAGSYYGLDAADTDVLVVTDYFADSLLFWNLNATKENYIGADDSLARGYYQSEDKNDPYQKILNTRLPGTFGTYVIGAVVETGYRERYAELIALMTRYENEPANRTKILEELVAHPLRDRFLTEANNSLNIAYSLNPKYKEAVLDMETTYNLTVAQYIGMFDAEDRLMLSLVSEDSNRYFVMPVSFLEKGQMVLGSTVYAALTGKQINLEYNEAKLKTEITKAATDLAKMDETDEKYAETKEKSEMTPLSLYVKKAEDAGFIGQEAALRFLRIEESMEDGDGVAVDGEIVTVMSKCGGTDVKKYVLVSMEDYREIKSSFVFSYAFLLDDTSQCYKINDTAKENYFYSTLSAYTTIFNICDIISVFEDVFVFVFIALIGASALVLLSHNRRMIKRSQYLIGVYKSIGYRSATFVRAAFCNSIYTMAAISVFTFVFSYGTNALVNDILAYSFARFMNAPFVRTMTLMKFSFRTFGLYMGVAVVLSLCTLIAPVWAVKKCKPNTILGRAVER